MKMLIPSDSLLSTRPLAFATLMLCPLFSWAENKVELPILKVEAPTPEKLSQMPQNLARWYMGSILFSEKEGSLVSHSWQDAYQKSSPATLLSDDPTMIYPLTADSHKFVIDLAEYHQINKFSFYNASAAGRVRVFYSDAMQPSESSRWRKASKPLSFDRKNSNYKIDLDFIDTRYVLIDFDIVQNGGISSLGLYGKLSLIENRYNEASTDQTSAPQAVVSTDFNFASVYSGAEISHVTSGPEESVVNMIDGDLDTHYTFGEEEESILVVDLSNRREIKRISMVLESGFGEIDFYIVNDLPESMLEESPEMAYIWNNGSLEPLLLASNEGLSEKRLIAQATLAPVRKATLPKSFFADHAPHLSRSIDNESKSFRVDIKKVGGRYFLARWKSAPKNTPPATLRIFEIGLFGEVLQPDRILQRIPLFEFLDDLPPGAENPGDQGIPPENGPLDTVEPPNPISPLGFAP